jgi:Asp-tRNA(Asn)/Glu-tRNA(Gln) amidotransferase A subunit family amidase
MKATIVFLSIMLLAATAAAQQDVTYTPTSGTFPVKVATAASDQDSFDTASVEIRQVDGTVLACVAAQPGQSVTVPTTVGLSSLPIQVRAVAYSEPGCAGVASPESPNSGTLTLNPPGAPVLE